MVKMKQSIILRMQTLFIRDIFFYKPFFKTFISLNIIEEKKISDILKKCRNHFIKI